MLHRAAGKVTVERAAPAAGTAVVELDGVVKRYGERVVVSDLSLQVAAGEWLTLLGPSGCGKTTTLRLVGGFLAPDHGTIALRGQDVTRVPPERRGLGFVFQSYALFPHMTVAKNVAFGLERHKIRRSELVTRVSEALDVVQLTGYEKHKPGQLSGGQQQRVALARALAIRPPALLLDEPLSNLDASLRETMRSELRDLHRRLSLTTIFVTHDQQEALGISDRVGVMSAGVLVEIGTPEQVYERPRSEFTARFMGFRNIFRGHAVARSEDSVHVTLGTDLIIEAATSHPSARDDDATVAIRPENVILTADGELPGVVTGSTYLGEHVRCELETVIGAVSVLTPVARAPRAGERVAAHFPPLAARELAAA